MESLERGVHTLDGLNRVEAMQPSRVIPVLRPRLETNLSATAVSQRYSSDGRDTVGIPLDAG